MFGYGATDVKFAYLITYDYRFGLISSVIDNNCIGVKYHCKIIIIIIIIKISTIIILKQLLAFVYLKGHVLAAPKTPNPPIQVLVPGVVETNKKAILDFQTVYNIEDIQRVTWKRRQSSQTPSSNATLTPDIILVTSTYTGVDTPRNITNWTLEEGLKLTEENGLKFSKVSVQDEGVYCCEILMKNDDRFEHCANVNVTGEHCFRQTH